MSKGYRQRRNKKIPSPQPTATSLAEENLRELNKTLIGAIKQKEVEISSLKRNVEKLSSKDQTIGSILQENQYLTRKLEDLRREYDDLKESNKMEEIKLMRRVCDMEGRLDIVALEHTRALAVWNKEKGFLQGHIRKIYTESKKERDAWGEQKKALEDTASRLQKSLRESQEEKDKLLENLSILGRNNEVLARNYVKERDENRKTGVDLAQARRVIQILFNELNRCRDDLKEENKGREVFRHKISSMEAECQSLRDENAVMKSQFGKLRESGAWTGVILDRQENVIQHLRESLREEKNRVKDANGMVDKCLEQLAAERGQTDTLNADLMMSREKNNIFLEELEELRRNKNEFEEITREHKALKDSSAQTHRELQLLIGRHAELQADNQSLRKAYSILQQDMTTAMVRLRKGIGMIKSI